jgi:peptide-methionine (S)-S-oxide reductase
MRFSSLLCFFGKGSAGKVLLATGVAFVLCISGNVALADDPASAATVDNANSEMAIATFGGGCFWCVEAVFERLDGVSSVVSGYEGGKVKNPTYEQVCTKKTGHIEVCQIHYDPKKISFDELLEVFFKTHDPTTRDRQGADAGPQYRSVIFYHDDEQKKVAQEHIKKIDMSRKLGRKIVTDVIPTETFYVAEDYHQDYFAKNPLGGYCQAVVRPKVEKVESEFGDKLKK